MATVTTTKNIDTPTLKKLTDVIETLMNNLPEDVDMQIIESAFNQVMKHNGLKFKEYNTLLDELCAIEYGFLLTPHDTVSDYFYDAINTKKISRDKIEVIINTAIIVAT